MDLTIYTLTHKHFTKPDGYDVRILVTLVAKDNHSHMEGIQAVSNIFADESKVNSLLNASTPQEIYNIFVENMG